MFSYILIYPLYICSRNISMMYPFFVLLPLPNAIAPLSVPDVGLGQLLALLQENSPKNVTGPQPMVGGPEIVQALSRV